MDYTNDELLKMINSCLTCFILSNNFEEYSKGNTSGLHVQAHLRFCNEKVPSDCEFFLRDYTMDAANSSLSGNQIRLNLNLIVMTHGKYYTSVLTGINCNPSNPTKFEFINFRTEDQFEEIKSLFFM